MVLVLSAHTNIMIFTTWEEIYYLHETWDYHISAQSMLSAWRKLGFLATHWAHSEDSDQTWQMPRLICTAKTDLTGRMPRLIWVFAGRSHFVDFVMRWLISEFFSNWSLMPFNLFLTLRSISGFNKRLTPQACFKKIICHMASRLTV